MIPPGGSRNSLTAIGRKAYWRAEDARVVLEAWRRSGLTLSAFARRTSLKPNRLAWWRDRLESSAAPRFHPVRVVGQPLPGPAATIEVIAGTRRVVVPAGFNAAHLQAVLRALEDAGC